MIKSVNPVHGRFWTPLIQLGRLQLLMPHTDEQRSVLQLNFVKVPPSSRRASLCPVSNWAHSSPLFGASRVYTERTLISASKQFLNICHCIHQEQRNIHTGRVRLCALLFVGLWTHQSLFVTIVAFLSFVIAVIKFNLHSVQFHLLPDSWVETINNNNARNI